MATHPSIPQLGPKELREFGLSTGVIVIALFGVLLPWLFNRGWPLWPWLIAITLGLLALIRPMWLRGIYRGWMRFGLMASRVTTPLLLGMVFFLMIAPMGLARRLMGRDTLAKTFSPDGSTYRVKSESSDKDRMEKPY
jgi:hypothetical protein